MTTILYKIVGGFGECRDFSGDDGALLRVKIDGSDGGIVTVGGISKRVTKGEARLNLSSLSDGDYSPSYVTEGGLIQLERIRKCGNKLTRPPIDAALVARLLLRTEALENECEGLKRRLCVCESAIGGGLF